ncbi:MAG: hypothetical protein U0234_03400 [Sandaracinus sp.]
MVLPARRVALFAVLFGSIALPACSSVPTFPATPRDGGATCSQTSPCASGQVCIQGLCFPACDMMHPCATNETCMAGICVARSGDGGITRDVGVDGGACAQLRCESMTSTPICRPDVAACVTCTASDSSHCGGGSPICDVGHGTCAPYTSVPCAPCNSDLDCDTVGHCVTTATSGPIERVCLPHCDAAGQGCPQGFSCPGADMDCIPFSASCAAYRAASAAQPCTADTDCVQLGGDFNSGVVTGMCRDTGAGMTCHVACGGAGDCPPAVPTCNSDLFCQ